MKPMGRKKESKPLLSSLIPGHSSSSSSTSLNSASQNTYVVKKIHKGKVIGKSKLASVNEGNGNGSNSPAAAGGGGETKEMSKTKCLEKDVDESENKMKQVAGEGKSCSHSFGVRSYLHHFYEAVSTPNSTTGQVKIIFIIYFFVLLLVCLTRTGSKLPRVS